MMRSFFSRRTLVTAVAAFDDSNEWDTQEGCASMAAWLRTRGRMTPGDAARLARTARLFAEQEDDLVPLLAEMDTAVAATAMKGWAAAAREVLDDHGSEPDPDRSAHLSPTLEGGRLDANLDPEAFHAAEAALRLAMGTKTDDDPRSLAQRRHDALVEVFTHYLDHQATRTGGHRRPHLNVTIGLDALVESTGQGTFDDATPISAADARRLACDANIHRVITRADGSVLDYGRATRTISAALFTVLTIRDHGCRFPGCDRPAHTTDAHHIRHWIDGGETEPDNLVLLCRWHHGVIHRPGWTISLEPGNEITVATPDGRRRTSRPPDAAALTTTAAA